MWSFSHFERRQLWEVTGVFIRISPLASQPSTLSKGHSSRDYEVSNNIYWYFIVFSSFFLFLLDKKTSDSVSNVLHFKSLNLKFRRFCRFFFSSSLRIFSRYLFFVGKLIFAYKERTNHQFIHQRSNCHEISNSSPHRDSLSSQFNSKLNDNCSFNNFEARQYHISQCYQYSIIISIKLWHIKLYHSLIRWHFPKLNNIVLNFNYRLDLVFAFVSKITRSI